MKEISLATKIKRRTQLRKLGWKDKRLNDVRLCRTLEEYTPLERREEER